MKFHKLKKKQKFETITILYQDSNLRDVVGINGEVETEKLIENNWSPKCRRIIARAGGAMARVIGVKTDGSGFDSHKSQDVGKVSFNAQQITRHRPDQESTSRSTIKFQKHPKVPSSGIHERHMLVV